MSLFVYLNGEISIFIRAENCTYFLKRLLMHLIVFFHFGLGKALFLLFDPHNVSVTVITCTDKNLSLVWEYVQQKQIAFICPLGDALFI